ncbi:hypothetical protein [Halobacillus sp. Marseille-Q1614]|uniref:hypothetical protein n=1 Tax=Halobacillus sp. Marseille-Q1614 TaxID=2709134 RepID=UPI00156F49A9|nr:hypothetical protein [Halobacillus sp. Marseille-Q1614]
MKRFLGYLFMTIFISALVFYGYKIPLDIKENMSFEAPIHVFTILTAIFPVIIGVLMRLPKLIIEIRGTTRLGFDWIKLLAIGGPALYISQMLILYFYTPFGHILPFGGTLVNTDTPIAAVAGVVFGYVLLDSLKMRRKKRTVIR